MPYRTKRIKYSTLISPKYIQDVKQTGWLITRFFKKLRKKFQDPITFFAIGEHGTKNTHRAHWHIILFGINKEDLEGVQIGTSPKGKPIYYSKIIEKLWEFEDLNIGKHTISDVTDRTIKYTANYTMKKMYNAEKGIYPTTMRFSTRNKIGTKWCRRMHKELRKGYLEDSDGGKYAIPKAFIEELKRYTTKVDSCVRTHTDQRNILETLLEIEKIGETMFLKLREQIGVKTMEEYTRRKAERLKHRLDKQERDFF